MRLEVREMGSERKPVKKDQDEKIDFLSVITEDVPDGALALGRARQETRPGLAARLMARLRAAKAKGGKG